MSPRVPRMSDPRWKMLRAFVNAAKVGARRDESVTTTEARHLLLGAWAAYNSVQCEMDRITARTKRKPTAARRTR